MPRRRSPRDAAAFAFDHSSPSACLTSDALPLPQPSVPYPSVARVCITRRAQRICQADIDDAVRRLGIREVPGRRSLQRKGKRGWFAVERSGGGSGVDDDASTGSLLDKLQHGQFDTDDATLRLCQANSENPAAPPPSLADGREGGPPWDWETEGCHAEPVAAPFAAEGVVVLYGLVRHAAGTLPSVAALLGSLPPGFVAVAHTWSDQGAGPGPVEAALAAAGMWGCGGGCGGGGSRGIVLSSPQAEADAELFGVTPFAQGPAAAAAAASGVDPYHNGFASLKNQLRASASLARAFAAAPAPARATLFVRLDCKYVTPLVLPRRRPGGVDHATPPADPTGPTGRAGSAAQAARVAVGPRECFTPPWAAHGGVNDRFALCGPVAARAYAGRGAALAGFLAAGIRSHTEVHLKRHLKRSGVQLRHLGPTFVFLRVRADGTTPKADAARVPFRSPSGTAAAP